MIVVCQTNDSMLMQLRRSLAAYERVHLTGSPARALALVRGAEIAPTERVVIICSNQYTGWPLDGSFIARQVKKLSPGAWCLLYTTQQPQSHEGIDGVITKLAPAVPHDAVHQLINAHIDELGIVEDLDALFALFSWIRPVMRSTPK